MGQMQDKIMTALRGLAEAAGLDFEDQPDVSNTGTVYVQRGFDTLAVLRYSFQQDYCTLQLSGRAVDAAGLADNPPAWRLEDKTLAWHHLGYDAGTRLQEMLDLVRKVLDQAP
jgi:hypothetical protein